MLQRGGHIDGAHDVYSGSSENRWEKGGENWTWVEGGRLPGKSLLASALTPLWSFKNMFMSLLCSKLLSGSSRPLA